jgi:N-acetylmuramic acid 6-phosphate etherase
MLSGQRQPPNLRWPESPPPVTSESVGNVRILGIEGGGSKTAWVLVESEGGNFHIIEEGQLPPTNFRLTSRERLAAIFREMPREVERLGAFLAGCGEEDQAALAKLCAEIWPNAAIIVGSDRASGFAAAFGNGDGIAVNAGTGSSITARRGGRMEQAGGWGHILGDAGGGYYLALQTLRFVLRDHDLYRRSSDLSPEILRLLCLNDLNQLVRWAQTAGKMEIATLAPIVFAAAAAGHEQVKEILHAGARVLAEYTRAVAERLEYRDPPVALLGSLFREHSIYVEIFRGELAALLPTAPVSVAQKSSSLGAAWLALSASAKFVALPETSTPEVTVASTEQPNERSLELDKLSARELVDLFVAEEAFVQEALRAAAGELATGLMMAAEAMQNGGRLFYVGAGTSGRLGVLDASEIPPTFGAPPELVQGIIAGGAEALHHSVEGAEDAAGAGALAVAERGVAAGDVLCGISASGRTPFVRGALQGAKERGARTILLSCNPAAADSPNELDVRIILPTGAELLTGSTRLKAGTATKVALNILSTGAMIRLGRVRGNLMIDLAATNEKLRDRATRLVAQLAACDYEAARARLARNGWSVRAALATLKPAE